MIVYCIFETNIVIIIDNIFFYYQLTVPTATISGGPDLHVDKGSTINLTCTVKFSPEPPAYIFWYHHEEVNFTDNHLWFIQAPTHVYTILSLYINTFYQFRSFVEIYFFALLFKNKNTIYYKVSTFSAIFYILYLLI